MCEILHARACNSLFIINTKLQLQNVRYKYISGYHNSTQFQTNLSNEMIPIPQINPGSLPARAIPSNAFYPQPQPTNVTAGSHTAMMQPQQYTLDLNQKILINAQHGIYQLNVVHCTCCRTC